MSKTKVKINPLKIDLSGEAKKILETAGHNCCELIKRGSPKGSGDYINGWTYTLENDDETVVVYNDGDDKTLTHLLELGHRTRLGKKYGKQKRSKKRKKKRKSIRSKKGRKATIAPQEHIRPAYNIVAKQYLEECKRIKIMEQYKK